MEKEIKRIGLDMGYKTTDKIIGYIYETTDYSKLTTFKENRTPDHAAPIIKNIVDNGALDMPGLVTEHPDYPGKLVIIDGNNTRSAREDLGLPYIYAVLKDATVNEMRTANLCRKNWTKQNYIDMYAKQGKPAYVKFKEIQSEYPDLAFTTIEAVLRLSLSRDTLGCMFKDGKDVTSNASYAVLERGLLEIPDIMESRRIFNFLMDVKRLERNDIPVYKRPNFAKCVLRLSRLPEFSMSDVLDAIKKYPTKFYSCETVKDFGHMLQELVNYNHKADNRVYFNIKWTK